MAQMGVIVYGRAFFLPSALQHTVCVEHSFRFVPGGPELAEPIGERSDPGSAPGEERPALSAVAACRSLDAGRGRECGPWTPGRRQKGRWAEASASRKKRGRPEQNQPGGLPVGFCLPEARMGSFPALLGRRHGEDLPCGASEVPHRENLPSHLAFDRHFTLFETPWRYPLRGSEKQIPMSLRDDPEDGERMLEGEKESLQVLQLFWRQLGSLAVLILGVSRSEHFPHGRSRSIVQVRSASPALD
jgi:hypothetical protein